MLRLGSVVEYEFGPNTGAISLIYSHLLKKYDVEIDKDILVNHIGAELQEQIVRHGNQLGINIQWTLPSDFKLLGSHNKNLVFMEIINEALLRLAIESPQIDIIKIKAIRQEILDKGFSFDIVYKSFVNKNRGGQIAHVLIHPELEKFNYYLSIEEDKIERCRVMLYSGKTTAFYIPDLFFYGKWKGIKEFIVSGKRSEIEIHVCLDGCRVTFVNLSGDSAKAPLFELFKSETDEKRSLQDYLYSLNPALSAIIIQSLS
ncbi:MAG TPA: hypothetical protein VHD83_22270 [Puia sp.]|nr:hypothetical protein [Puia sp.]